MGRIHQRRGPRIRAAYQPTPNVLNFLGQYMAPFRGAPTRAFGFFGKSSRRCRDDRPEIDLAYLFARFARAVFPPLSRILTNFGVVMLQ